MQAKPVYKQDVTQSGDTNRRLAVKGIVRIICHAAANESIECKVGCQMHVNEVNAKYDSVTEAELLATFPSYRESLVLYNI